VVCCAGTSVLVAFGAGALLATFVAELGKAEVLLPAVAILVAAAAVIFARRRQ